MPARKGKMALALRSVKIPPPDCYHYHHHHNSYHNQITIIIFTFNSCEFLEFNHCCDQPAAFQPDFPEVQTQTQFLCCDRVHRVHRLPLLGTNIAKGTTDPRVEFCLSKSLQNLKQASTFQLNLTSKS